MLTAEMPGPVVEYPKLAPHVICPICPVIFTSADGWVHHMRVDHWWELKEGDSPTFDT
jgi:hypothetical protein